MTLEWEGPGAKVTWVHGVVVLQGIGLCVVDPVAIPVVIGLDDGTNTEIVKGALQVGDQVITAETRAQTSGTTVPQLRL